MARPLATPDLVVCAHTGADLRRSGAVDLASLRPLFPGRHRRPGAPVVGTPDLSTYYRVDSDSAPNVSADEMIARLNEVDEVAGAFVRPEVLTTGLPASAGRAAPDAPRELGPAADFSDRQHYLAPADEGGVDAAAAWDYDGGRGAGIRVIDVEREWHAEHEDIQLKHFVLRGSPSGDYDERNHGTNVLGVLAARHDNRGVKGLCPEAMVNGMSIEREPGIDITTVIYEAGSLLGYGDILLLEMHGRGPLALPNDSESQHGYIPIEFWPAERAAIQYAVNRGVIVVAAAGNGAQNLDADDYDQPLDGHFQNWRNPFRFDERKNLYEADSGAILVGAGAPPQGLFAHDYGPDRGRMEFSNYGARVDTQAWGCEVVTTGGFNMGFDGFFPVADESRWYTDQFNGTSSAAAIVAGALACVQGALRGLGYPVLEPLEARHLLRTLGRAQHDSEKWPATQRIGPRLDLAELTEMALERRKPEKDPIVLPKRSKQMSTYNLYFGDGAAPHMHVQPGAITVSDPMDADQVDLSHVKGPGALVVFIDDRVVVIEVGDAVSALPTFAPSDDATGLNASSVDLTHVKGPGAGVLLARPGDDDGTIDVSVVRTGG